MSAATLVERLEFCKPSGKGVWMARCPAHEDKSPSLKVTECSDGRVLIHCHAGCSALDVISAVGLEWDALFPPTDRNYHAERKQREHTHDELVILIAESDIAAGKTLNDTDLDTYRQALLREMGAENAVV